MSAPSAIGAVVVTHASAETIDACLSRLRASESVAAIRVVDNDSRDATLEIVQRHALADPRVRFIANPDNPGFAVGCNQGAADVHPLDGVQWLAFVNPDCLVEADTLARLRDAASERGGNMLLGADLVDESGTRDTAARRRDPDFGAMLRGAMRGSDARASLDVVADDRLALQPVDAVSGALMVMPRALFDRIGGFDCGYRLHAEDLDLCRRVRVAGGRVAVANHVRVVHVRGVSSRTRPLFVEWHKHRGLLRYFRKFESARHGRATHAAIALAIAARFCVAALRATWRARRSLSDRNAP